MLIVLKFTFTNYFKVKFSYCFTSYTYIQCKSACILSKTKISVKLVLNSTQIRNEYRYYPQCCEAGPTLTG